MKNCDTCINFIKIRTWRDGRKGMCDYTDWNIVDMKGKPCPYYKAKDYNRLYEKIKNALWFKKAYNDGEF